MSDLSVLETRTGYEEQKKIIYELQSRLADAELKIVEGEKLRKKLHNTILVNLAFLNYFLIFDSINFVKTINSSVPTGIERQHSSFL